MSNILWAVLQAFINQSFENITSTDHALSLLAQFTSILRRDSLRQELESKYQVIFQHYARDLEAVQAQYEANKHKPPVPRNAPPIAGNIIWARQLLRRIEEPMQRFAQNKQLMAMKESKKVIKTYNRVGAVVSHHVPASATSTYMSLHCSGKLQACELTSPLQPVFCCKTSPWCCLSYVLDTSC